MDPGAEAGTILRTVHETELSVSLIVATHAISTMSVHFARSSKKAKAQFPIHEADRGLMLSAPVPLLSSLAVSPIKSPPRPHSVPRHGSPIDLGEQHFEALYTPGHTPGGVCIFRHRVVFCADILLKIPELAGLLWLQRPTSDEKHSRKAHGLAR